MSYILNNDDRHVIFEKAGFHSIGMKLVFCGKQINPCKEQNILSNSEFGFNVYLVYTKEWTEKYIRPYLTDGYIDNIYNCTQVHYGYTDMGLVKPLTKIAFESDIHQTGFNRQIKGIESVEITLATKKHYDYHIE